MVIRRLLLLLCCLLAPAAHAAEAGGGARFDKDEGGAGGFPGAFNCFVGGPFGEFAQRVRGDDQIGGGQRLGRAQVGPLPAGAFDQGLVPRQRLPQRQPVGVLFEEGDDPELVSLLRCRTLGFL